MSSLNYIKNKAALEKYRKQLIAELGEISEIDKKILQRAVNEGVAEIKKNTPVDTGVLRKSWKSAPAVKGHGGVKKVLVNTADYAEFVNYGHRIVSRKKETVGFVKGNYMLENGVTYISKRLMELFAAEIQRIGRKYDG